MREGEARITWRRVEYVDIRGSISLLHFTARWPFAFQGGVYR